MTAGAKTATNEVTQMRSARGTFKSSTVCWLG